MNAKILLQEIESGLDNNIIDHDDLLEFINESDLLEHVISNCDTEDILDQLEFDDVADYVVENNYVVENSSKRLSLHIEFFDYPEINEMPILLHTKFKTLMEQISNRDYSGLNYLPN